MESDRWSDVDLFYETKLKKVDYTQDDLLWLNLKQNKVGLIIFLKTV